MASLPVVLLIVLQWLHEHAGGTAKLNISCACGHINDFTLISTGLIHNLFCLPS